MKGQPIKPAPLTSHTYLSPRFSQAYTTSQPATQWGDTYLNFISFKLLIFSQAALLMTCHEILILCISCSIRHSYRPIQTAAYRHSRGSRRSSRVVLPQTIFFMASNSDRPYYRTHCAILLLFLAMP